MPGADPAEPKDANELAFSPPRGLSVQELPIEKERYRLGSGMQVAGEIHPRTGAAVDHPRPAGIARVAECRPKA